MAKVKFTANVIEGATCEPGKAQSFLWDSEAPGLGLRVTAAGAKSYIFQSRVHDKPIRLTIGDVNAWRLDAPARSQENSARKEARRLQTLCDAGIDPRQEKQDKKAASEQRKAEAEAHKREEQRQRVTLGEVWPVYIDDRRHAWGERHLLDHFKVAQLGGQPKKRGKGETMPGPLAALLPVKLADLTPAKVTAWLKRENETRPARAALAFRLMIGFASWCKESRDYAALLPEGAFTAKKVREAVAAPASKTDCLQREQLAAWFAAVRQLDNPVQSAYLQTLLLTGSRREELAELRWDDVDFQWRSLTIKDKVEGERVIPLTPYAASILACLPRRNEWVFSSPTAAGGRIVEPRIAHNRALAAAGLPALTLHGLRRSFGTLAEWVEMPAGVVAQIMGHKPSAIAEKHYRRRPLDLLRKWHDQLEGWILEQAGIEQPQADTAAARLRVVA
ncbi:tyrosine-type recombinase/integrase [Gulbenkiania mobilis]|uniref:Uncharacterized protein DUF4102 n=1 Tax=Gulbenkiania mobilis TaxID=397457 RepID=A0ABY2CTQ8_GULMO|nr:uncharacterized protein DUF4102 [Gulbenkiania mobilis]